MHIRARNTIALAAISGLALTACGGGWSQSEIEDELETELNSRFPEDEPHEVDCPGDMEVEEGEQMTCELSDASGSGSLIVEITSVDGGEFQYEANVGEDYAPNDG